jgi:hypothetical protein
VCVHFNSTLSTVLEVLLDSIVKSVENRIFQSHQLEEVNDFGTGYLDKAHSTMFGCYDKVRRRAAELQKNPRLLSIELRTFRHWGGTMIAHYTNGNVLTVKDCWVIRESKTA